MTKFTIENWEETLAKVYERAVAGGTPEEIKEYRKICRERPRDAVAMVSDIELPDYFDFKFVEHRKEMSYSFLLPPTLPEIRAGDRHFEELIQTLVCCTHPTFTAK